MALLRWLLFVALSLSLISASAHTHGNPADELADVINNNRSAHKLSRLYDNPGLGCMALQYTEAYNGTCNETEVPPEVDITEIFAPDCGVELPTVETISGRLLGCRSDYLDPPQAFSQVLVKSNKSLSIVNDKAHTEMGVGIGGRGPYFWCVLFGSGAPNSTFKLEGGQALEQREGCFSGTGAPCSEAAPLKHLLGLSFTIIFFSCFALRHFLLL
eukprot:TRINITY_DN12210_c0_g1_i1.p1 TRINITY_DN12210_c0_g1~~TRINITY_DN12210_c0_g1_i1.p1  ORF type:complete len:215 (-),score=17.81 TRINITY_DN12210_c0_g1_i1:56-700(-)